MPGSPALIEESGNPAARENGYLNYINHSLSSGVASLHLQEGFRDFRKREGLFNDWPDLQNTRRDQLVNKKAYDLQGRESVCSHPVRLPYSVRGLSFPTE